MPLPVAWGHRRPCHVRTPFRTAFASLGTDAARRRLWKRTTLGLSLSVEAGSVGTSDVLAMRPGPGARRKDAQSSREKMPRYSSLFLKKAIADATSNSWPPVGTTSSGEGTPRPRTADAI